MKKAKREAAAQRRPAQSERKNRAFSTKRQAVCFETQSVSNGKSSQGRDLIRRAGYLPWDEESDGNAENGGGSDDTKERKDTEEVR